MVRNPFFVLVQVEYLRPMTADMPDLDGPASAEQLGPGFSRS